MGRVIKRLLAALFSRRTEVAGFLYLGGKEITLRAGENILNEEGCEGRITMERRGRSLRITEFHLRMVPACDGCGPAIHLLHPTTFDCNPTITTTKGGVGPFLYVDSEPLP